MTKCCRGAGGPKRCRPNGEARPKPTVKHFELIPFDQIKFDGAEEWLVKGLLPRHGVGAFFGAKSAFKSFAAQDLALHVACGWNWAGRRATQTPVVYIAAEGAGGFRKRKAGFELHHAEHLPEIVPFHLIAAAPNLGQGTADLEALAAAVRAAGVSPGLIVIDTLAQTLGSAEENGAGMIQLIANATALSQQFSCFVLLVHHSGLTEADRLRGHSSLGVRIGRAGVLLVVPRRLTFPDEFELAKSQRNTPTATATYGDVATT